MIIIFFFRFWSNMNQTEILLQHTTLIRMNLSNVTYPNMFLNSMKHKKQQNAEK